MSTQKFDEENNLLWLAWKNGRSTMIDNLLREVVENVNCTTAGIPKSLRDIVAKLISSKNWFRVPMIINELIKEAKNLFLQVPEDIHAPFNFHIENNCTAGMNSEEPMMLPALIFFLVNYPKIYGTTKEVAEMFPAALTLIKFISAHNDSVTSEEIIKGSSGQIWDMFEESVRPVSDGHVRRMYSACARVLAPAFVETEKASTEFSSAYGDYYINITKNHSNVVSELANAPCQPMDIMTARTAIQFILHAERDNKYSQKLLALLAL